MYLWWVYNRELGIKEVLIWLTTQLKPSAYRVENFRCSANYCDKWVYAFFYSHNFSVLFPIWPINFIENFANFPLLDGQKSSEIDEKIVGAYECKRGICVFIFFGLVYFKYFGCHITQTNDLIFFSRFFLFKSVEHRDSRFQVRRRTAQKGEKSIHEKKRESDR